MINLTKKEIRYLIYKCTLNADMEYDSPYFYSSSFADEFFKLKNSSISYGDLIYILNNVYYISDITDKDFNNKIYYLDLLTWIHYYFFFSIKEKRKLKREKIAANLFM